MLSKAAMHPEHSLKAAGPLKSDGQSGQWPMRLNFEESLEFCLMDGRLVL